MTKLQIRMLGAFGVRESGREISFATRRTQALFAYLAHTGTAHSREHLSRLLWDSVPTPTSTGNLRVLLTNLRHTVGPYVEITRTTVAFRPPGDAVVSLDAHVFSRRADALMQSGGADLSQPELRALEAALGWCKGHFLEGLDLPKATGFDDWVHHERKAINDRRTALLRELIESELTLAVADGAVTHSAQLLELDPYNETSHQLAIRARVLAGDLDTAVEQFEALESMLAEEFGAAPSVRSRALLAGLPARSSRGSRSRAANRLKRDGASLRSPWFRFVGRERELAAILEAYAGAAAGKGSGLLVRGESGSGKTVLVRQAVRLLLDRDSGVVVLAAGCTDVTGHRDDAVTVAGLAAQVRGDVTGSWIDGAIPPAVAQRLLSLRDLPIASGQRDVTVVVEGVRRIASSRPVVLVLDNLQWAGHGVTALLGELATDVRHRRVLLVCAGRSELLGGPAASEAIRRLVPRLLQHFPGRVVDLDEVAEGEGSGFANLLMDSEPNMFDADFRAALLHRSQDHALFTAELLRDMARRSVIRLDSSRRYRASTPVGWGPLPERVQAVIEERLSYVPSLEQRLLQAAAVLGEEFSAEVVSRLTGTALVQAVESFGSVLGSRGLRLVETVPTPRSTAPRYRFRYAMVQEHLEGSADRGLLSYLRNQLASNGWTVQPPGPGQDST